MKNLKREYLQAVLAHITYYNDMAPFPVFDTEYVEAIEKQLKNMDDKNYDNEPVEACGSCGSLHIISDDMQLHNMCMHCGSVNDLEKYDDIHEYLETDKGKFWADQWKTEK